MMNGPCSFATSELIDYKAMYPDEVSRFELLSKQLAEKQDIQSRSNMEGHITSSYMVLDPTLTMALMIYHNHLQKWLFPGGHYEGSVTPAISAERELEEETGFDLNNLKLFADRTLLLDIDTHIIPARPSKNEGEHFHHDFLYLAKAKYFFIPKPQLEEVTEAKWIDLLELSVSSGERVPRAAKKALALIKECNAT